MSKNGRSPIPQFNPFKPKVLNEGVSHYTKPDPELDFFHISFKYYNDSLCEVSVLDKHIARHTLENFKVIGRCYDFNSLQGKNIDITRVRPAGDYLKLFKNMITEDAELTENIKFKETLDYFILFQKKCLMW